MNRQYLRQWIDANYERLCQSEWYDDHFDGETMEDIETDFFIETYLIPLIESNVSWDFNRDINAGTLISSDENLLREIASHAISKAMEEHCGQELLVARDLGISVGMLRYITKELKTRKFLRISAEANGNSTFTSFVESSSLEDIVLDFINDEISDRDERNEILGILAKSNTCAYPNENEPVVEIVYGTSVYETRQVELRAWRQDVLERYNETFIELPEGGAS